MMLDPDAADRLALDWAAEHGWQRLVLWGEDVRGAAAEAHARWPEADISMWNDWVGSDVPGVSEVSRSTTADVVLVRLPKSLDALDAWLSETAQRFPEATVVCAGRVKHMSLGQNDVIRRHYEHLEASLARQKSRLLIASRPQSESSRFEPAVRVLDAGAGSAAGLTVVAVGGAFAGPKLDIGTRALLDALEQRLPADGDGSVVAELGCGTGVVAAWLARRGYRVRASDRSRAAVASTQMTIDANALTDRVDVVWEDALAAVAPGSLALIVLNPPFHEGTRVTVDPAHRLFAAAARALAPGGRLVVVWNTHLRYRAVLERSVGPTVQWARTPKFTVTVSTRRT